MISGHKQTLKVQQLEEIWNKKANKNFKQASKKKTVVTGNFKINNGWGKMQPNLQKQNSNPKIGDFRPLVFRYCHDENCVACFRQFLFFYFFFWGG